MAMVAVIAVGAAMMSAFTTAKQDASQIENSDDNWKVFREKVPYCDADKDVCMGYGKVWVNTIFYVKCLIIMFNTCRSGRRGCTVYQGGKKSF